MFDTCCEEVQMEKRDVAPMGSLMMDSVKMLCDLCQILNSIETIVFGKTDHMTDKPEVPECLQNRARMSCDLALTCIGKAKHIFEGLQ